MGGTETKEAGQGDEASADAAREKAAVRSAASWVQMYGFDRRTFERSVRRVVVDLYEYTRVLFVFEGRRVLLHTRPTKGETLLRAIPDPEALDPWEGDHEGLEEATRVAAKCPRCTNGARGRCGRCDGTRSAPCRGCDGKGRVPGVRGLKNCSECRGAGSKRCKDCSGAGLVCDLCEGSAQLIVWLAIEREARSEVAVGHPAMFMQPHPHVGSAADFDAGRWPNPLREDTGLLLADEVEVPADLVPNRRARERLVGARVQRFGWKAYTVEVESAFGIARIRLEGDPPTVNALRSDFSPFYGRVLAVAGMALLAVVGSFVLERAYEHRHAFFANYGYGPTVFWLAVVLGVAAVVVVAAATITPRARPKHVLPSACASTLVCSVATLLVFLVSRPTKAHALEALSKGEVAEATAEADALRNWKKDLDAAGEVTDELNLRAAADATSVAALGEIAKWSWRSKDKREQVVARLREAARREAPGAERRRAAPELESIAKWCDGADDALAGRYHAQAAVFAGERCVSVADIPCVIGDVARARTFGADRSAVEKIEADGREVVESKLAAHWAIAQDARAEPKARFAAIESALVASKQWADLRGGQSAPSKADIERLKSSLPRLIAEAKEKADRERRAREAAEEARERSTRVKCADGVFSPSCRCGGSLQGCCSHHGGVAGCGG